MDATPVLMFLRDERIPLRVRAALTIEGGFDDGLIVTGRGPVGAGGDACRLLVTGCDMPLQK
ncbi:hypothetical protein ACFV0T_31645 [Streptomyces sp. NPDC059582]|uniref:hypothetical protein n=1 Tax=Streptomyces sp. NPDC059582 TaxID=3346875 RepID=UPI00369CE9BF